MRWYVSRNGETVGPVEDADVAAWVRGGMRDAMIRDEVGGQWTPVAQSPFAALLPRPNSTPRWVWLGGAFVVLGGGFLLVNDPPKFASPLPPATQDAGAATCYVYWRDIYAEGVATATRPPMFPTEDAALLFQAAIGAHDNERSGEILSHAQVVDVGARAEILEKKPGMYRVQIGTRTGWILDDVCNAKPPAPAPKR